MLCHSLKKNSQSSALVFDLCSASLSHVFLYIFAARNRRLMRKTFILSVAIFALASAGYSQTVCQKGRWGEKLLFFQENAVRVRDRWGGALYYLDGNTLRRKDRWGEKLYYFDFTPSRWQIVCV